MEEELLSNEGGRGRNDGWKQDVRSINGSNQSSGEEVERGEKEVRKCV